MAHTTSSSSRPQLDQLRSMDAREASFAGRVRSEGEFFGACHSVHLLSKHTDTMHTLAAVGLEWYPQHYDLYTDFFDSSDSWVEISSQPSSSSLSSANDEIVTTGLRVQHEPRQRRRRVARPGAPSTLNMIARTSSTGATSSQDEYDESESESDRVMTSSGEGPYMANVLPPRSADIAQARASQHELHESSDDENRTAINYPIHRDSFTPQPNAFSHPPSAGHGRNASQPVPGSYFPASSSSRPTTRRSLPSHNNQSASHHLPQNILSPSYNAAAHHDEALRSSLNTLLSCAAAARSLSKPNPKQQSQQQQPQAAARGNRVDPMSFRLIPESALPQQQQTQQIFQEPTFKPTLRRTSTSTSSANSPSQITSPNPDRITKDMHNHHSKRKPSPSSKSRLRSPANKKSRHSSSASSSDPAAISPTLLTWVVSAGVVVVLSAISFSAGYSLGREAGKLEAEGFMVDFGAGREAGCAREVAGRSMGLKRSLAREALQV